MRWRWAGLAFLAIAVLAGVASWRRPAGGLAAAAPAVSAAVSSPGQAVATSQATVRPPALVASAGMNREQAARAELARRMKADWCGFGAAEHGRQTDTIFETASATQGSIGMEAIDEAQRTVGAELLEQAGNEAQRRWARLLMQRRDARSQALADYIGLDDEARARLQARARGSSDPMVTALALQHPCAAGACANVEASQWSRLEPANVQAWLAVLNGNTGRGQTQTAYVMERLVAEAKYSRTYESEALNMLLALAQSQPPGLQSDAELQRLYGLFAAWAISSQRLVLQACREGQAQTGMAARCDGIADLLWQQSDLLNRSLALAFARTALPARPERRALWEARAREFEAVRAWSHGEIERVIARFSPEGKEPAPCTMQAEAWQMLRESSRATDWDRARAQMQAAQVDEAALAAAWRKQEGRSALDPPRPASAPDAAR